MVKFYEAGKAAYANGDMRAPILNADVQQALIDLPVGDPRVLDIMQAFTNGFDAAAEVELSEIVANFERDSK